MSILTQSIASSPFDARHPAPLRARRFRPDIQGLRAVAVLLVVLYHAHVPGLRAGYVGVDVFFVVSGFLITGQLVREVEMRGRVHFTEFYTRRVRRLLPPALAAVIVTLLAARLWAPALQVKGIANDAIWTAFYGINYRLAAQGVDYLNADGPVSPLQHFWSLAVEEQFYLVWPVLIGLCALVGARRRGQALFLLLAGTVAASLYLSVTMTPRDPSLSYFSIQTRAWELGVGGLVAVAAHRLARMHVRMASCLSWAGLSVVVVSAFVYSDATVFPGWAAVLPVGGATLLVAAGCGPQAVGAESVLRNRWAQWIGKMSYSWYVWHWPVLVIAPMVVGSQGSFGWARNLEMAAIALWFAAITYYLIEYPTKRTRLRIRAWLTAGGMMSAAAVGCALLMVSSLPVLAGHGAAKTLVTTSDVADSAYAAQVRVSIHLATLMQGAPRNLTPDLVVAGKDYPESSFTQSCQANFTDVAQGPCVFGDVHGHHTLVLFGDSHAEQWEPAFAEAGRREHWRVINWTKSACTPAALSVFSSQLNRQYRECDEWREITINRIIGLKPDLVVMSQSDSVTGKAFTDQRYAQATVTTASRLKSAGLAVHYMLDTMYPQTDVPLCVSKHLSDVRTCGRPNKVNWITPRRSALEAALMAAKVPMTDPKGWQCADDAPVYCPVIIGNILVYRDSSHLTATYSRWLAPMVQGILRQGR
ncbi:peptidoglycan/LPS O-acetylase OafA/YrhL [Motilibacter peucedani]|uniref:Peptidoglycan/LPS O-acetylase OafA/YrhL n=1 Tax=Motilibacter peucedani TaxID=598650 RepID=A0A420XLN2_9ACTN|nr:acyltransferase family protein [Motilibacter peucedani]RKS71319.1 peptidoglycan/LPS O-acetylase OafA/YrhL [Motilibacter peucedani]